MMVQSHIEPNSKLVNKKSTNFNRYQKLTEKGMQKSKSRNIKLTNKPLFNPKKSRNNLTLDGMNLSSIEMVKMAHNNSQNNKVKSKLW